jgi:DNA primase
MGQFSQGTIEQVKDAADIVEVVSAYTDLRRVGDRHTGLCPFHDERSPSFSVDSREKLYHCFGCGVGGDVIKFVEEKEGLTFPEAVESLGERYGVEIAREEEDPRVEETRKRQVRLRELLDRTCSFYVSSLWESPEAKNAREYLLGRGLTEQTLRRFGVGYAPSAWDTVLMRGQRAGYKVPELAAAGLAQKGRQGGFYDCFRSRITFPIRDSRGRMQGFGARALRPDQKPKYKNSPENELFRKSKLVYAIDLARPAIAKAGRAVVMEGYTDVLAAHQAGIGEAVAVMGTAITPDQVQQLAQHTEEVVLAMDADSAGREAMLRAQRVAKGKRVRLRVAAMEPGSDPADVLTKGGEDAAARFGELLDTAADLPVFHTRMVLGAADLRSSAGRSEAVEAIAPLIKATTNPVEQEELVRLVSSRLEVDPQWLTDQVNRISSRPQPSTPRRTLPQPRQRRATGSARHADYGDDPGPGSAPAPAPKALPLTSRERRERMLLAMCVASSGSGARYLERITPEHLSTDVVVRARDWLLGHLDDPMGGLPREDEELYGAVSQIVMLAKREPAGDEALELNFLQLEIARVEREISAATEAGGDPPVELLREHARLGDELAGRVIG